MLDLLVLTKTGRVFCIGTKKPYNPDVTLLPNWYGASNVHTVNSEYHGNLFINIFFYLLKILFLFFIFYFLFFIFYFLFFIFFIFFIFFFYFKGIFVEGFSRVYRDVIGSSFTVVFTINDKRKMDESNPPFYNVEIFIDGALKMSNKFRSSGTLIWELPSPSIPKLSTIILKMTNEKGQIYFDYYTLSFNQHFAKTFKVKNFFFFFFFFFFFYFFFYFFF